MGPEPLAARTAGLALVIATLAGACADGGRGLVVTYAHPLGGFDEDVRVATPTLP